MLTVHLSDLRFTSFHGLYPEEAVLGNEFEVNINIDYDETHHQLDVINGLVDYELVYDIVRKRMAIPSALLEEVAETLILKIRHQYSFAQSISVSIFKLNPPIKQMIGKVGITLKKTFGD
ncbi:MAG: dihydroneopterin aldolase [Chitinophagaceae bacterium]